MSGSSTGTLFRLSSFGESHGPAIGGVVDGCPPGIELSAADLQRSLDRRRPGQSSVSSPRNERDQIEILSGLFEGRTTGTPIAFIIRNQDQRSDDYLELENVYRPSHADLVYEQKYGHRDYRGGGRSSARETAVRVAAGSIASAMLRKLGISMKAWVIQAGDIRLPDALAFADYTEEQTEASVMRCPVPDYSIAMEALIAKLKSEGDSCGGVVHCVVSGMPAGIGEPVYDKLSARLASAMMSINATRGIEFGSGFQSVGMKGSEHNDAYHMRGKEITTASNKAGGIQGGISNGNELRFNVAFKPPSTISREQSTVNKQGEEVVLQARGRHDPCVVPRAVPIVEAMCALTIADLVLMQGARIWYRQQIQS
jgi:chorismate synthase